MANKFIITETQEKYLANIIREEAYQMPVDKKVNKPFCVNPEKVQLVKRFLDNGFQRGSFESIGADGLPCKTKIVAMLSSTKEPLKNMYMDQLHDLLIDHFQNMFSDHEERSAFLKQVMNDWYDNKIGVHGTLSVNRILRENITYEEATERSNEADLHPTEAQMEAGNYKMGHFSVKGMPISIENPKGSFRSFKRPDGTKGKVEMMNHYGYFTNTTGNGKDGDAVDVFIGPEIETFDKVYIVDQKVEGKFDESKVMLGFASLESAKKAYLDNYDTEWTGFWKITGVPLKIFKKWLYRERKQRKPFYQYVMIKRNKVE